MGIKDKKLSAKLKDIVNKNSNHNDRESDEPMKNATEVNNNTEPNELDKKVSLDEEEVFNSSKELKLRSLGVKPERTLYKKLHAKVDEENIDEPYINETRKYWKKAYGKKVDPLFHIFMDQNFGLKDYRFLPPNQYIKMQKIFNETKKKSTYTDKNLYDLIVRTEKQPKNFLKRVNGNYFTFDNTPLLKEGFTEYFQSLGNNATYIIKPSRTANGKKINKIIFNEDNFEIDGEIVNLEDIEKAYGRNFLIQEKVNQHAVLEKLHPASVNTIRIVTFRWDGEITHLLSFLRVGVGGAVNDNAGTGGICIGVKENGQLQSFAVSENGDKWLYHPTTNYDFSEETIIPNFEKCVNFVIELHRDVLHHDLISWDVAVGEDGEPIFIEHNFGGAMYIYQMACQKPLFGEKTEEVLAYIRQHK
jgi:hypothetical protein